MSMRPLKITNSITSRESKSLEKYLQEVNKLELLLPEEEFRLALLIQKGDKKAFDRLVSANLRFVVSVAKQYQNQGFSLSDLVNEGNLGLLKAARKFDATRGFKFISYAVWWIRQHIIQALAENAQLIRIPMNKLALRRTILKAGYRLEQTLERTATSEELAEELKIAEEDIVASGKMNARHISLDTPLSDQGEDNLMDVLNNPNAVNADQELVYTASLKLEIDRSLQSLNVRQRETICYFFGIGTDHALSLEEIGDKLSLTRERVRQIKDKAIGVLRTTPGFHLLRSYLGT